MPEQIRKRCPKGSRRNPKTKRCNKIKKETKIIKQDGSLSKSIEKKIKKRCPNGTRRNPTTGNCEDKNKKISKKVVKTEIKLESKKKIIEDKTSCDTTTICQYGASCWFVSIFLLLIKVKPLYNLLKEDHQKFCDGLLVCQNRMEQYCKLPPKDIWDSYRSKHKKHKSLHRAYDGKNSIQISLAFNIGAFPFLLFKCIMNTNNIYYLNQNFSYPYGKIFKPNLNFKNNLDTFLKKVVEKCNWLRDNYNIPKENLLKEINNDYDKHKILNEILRKYNLLTEENLKKGICYRTRVIFSVDKRAESLSNMRVPELYGIKSSQRGKWGLETNWLSNLAKDNPSVLGGWFILKYPIKIKIGGVTHTKHATSFSVCRDNENVKINICNSWGGKCSFGKENPWKPWTASKIILTELSLIQYFPPI